EPPPERLERFAREQVRRRAVGREGVEDDRVEGAPAARRVGARVTDDHLRAPGIEIEPAGGDRPRPGRGRTATRSGGPREREAAGPGSRAPPRRGPRAARPRRGARRRAPTRAPSPGTSTARARAPPARAAAPRRTAPAPRRGRSRRAAPPAPPASRRRASRPASTRTRAPAGSP